MNTTTNTPESTQADGNVMSPEPAKRRAGGPRVIALFKRGNNCICGHYEGDLALTCKIGPYLIKDLPLNDAYVILLRGFWHETQQIVNQGMEPEDVCEQLKGLYAVFSQYGIDLHLLAGRTVVCDSSRATTALTLANNYQYTLIYAMRALLCDGLEGVEGCVRVDMDVNLAGLERFDGLGFADWGFSPSVEITKVTRCDLSRGRNYVSSREDKEEEDPRVAALTSLMQGGARPMDLRMRSVFFHSLADAFRGTKESIVSELVNACQAFRASALEEARGSDGEYIDDLSQAIRDRYQCTARHEGSEHVRLAPQGKVIFDGAVEIFRLTGDNVPDHGYAWSSRSRATGTSRIITVLGETPVLSATLAAKFVMEGHGQNWAA